jgi:hypothetical protein
VLGTEEGIVVLVKIKPSKVIGLALNLKEHCDVCLPHCWNSILNEKFHAERVGSLTVDTKFDELIEQLDNGRIPKPKPEAKCQFYTNSGRDLLLGAKAEFFHPDSLDTAMQVLQLLEVYPEVSARARCLTKQDISDVIPRLPADIWVGASITTLSTKISKILQPRAAEPQKLIEMLQEANDVGFPTWVVVEPFFLHMDVWKLIDELQFVKEMWIGRLNGGRSVPVIEDESVWELVENISPKEIDTPLILKSKGIGSAVKTVGDFAESDKEIVRQFRFAEKNISEAVKQKDIVNDDGTITYNHDTPFSYRLLPKKEVKRLLEKELK